MTGNAPAPSPAVGNLGAADGTGVVRVGGRIDARRDDVWSALTDPARLARWLGNVEGDLHLDGEFRARFHASGWEGTGRVSVCERARRLRVETWQPDQEGGHSIEVTLTGDGDQTDVVWEERGMPLDYLAAYGAGIQVHVEDLAGHFAGRDRCNADARWNELMPGYRVLASTLDF